MASAATLATMKVRVLAFLLDAGGAKYANATIEEALTLALNEYSRAYPQMLIGTVTPTVNAREVSLSTLTGIVDVWRVWYPYIANEHPPKFAAYEVLNNAGVLSLHLNVATAPSGSDVARVYYLAPHTLKDLNSGAATTYFATDDGLIAMGAAGHAMYTRAISLCEDVTQQIAGVPALSAMGGRLLREFRFRLGEAR
jgi:hypothetical protein